MNKIIASALAIIGTGAIIFVTKKLIHCVKVAKMDETTTEIVNEEPETMVVEPEIVDPQEPISETETVVEEVEEPSSSSEENNTTETEEVK